MLVRKIRPQSGSSFPKPFSAIPRIGILNLLTSDFSPYQAYEYYSKMHKKHGDIFVMDLFGEKMVVVGNADEYEKLYRATGKFPNGLTLKPFMYRESLILKKDPQHECSLASLRGEKWKQHRRNIDEKFMNYDVIDAFVPELNGICDDLVNVFKSKMQMDRQVADLERTLFGFSGEGVGTFIYGYRPGMLSREELESETGKVFLAHLSRSMRLGCEMAFSVPWYRLFPTKTWKQFTESVDYLHSVGREFFQASDEYHKSTGKPRTDFVQHLRDKGENERRILDNVITLFTAGVDSTSNTILWLIQTMGIHQDQQEKCREEIMKYLPERAPLDADSLSKLKYLKATIKESMRMNTVSIGNLRNFNEPMVVLGYEIPPETPILLFHYHTNTHDKNFQNAAEFNPMRWIDRSIKPSPFAFMPFGFGARMCPGSRLSELETEAAFVKLLQNFKWKTTEAVYEKQMQFFIKPAKPLNISWEVI